MFVFFLSFLQLSGEDKSEPNKSRWKYIHIILLCLWEEIKLLYQ